MKPLHRSASHARHRRRSKRFQAGFSLLELTIVITMITILGAISITSATSQWRNEQTYAVAQQLSSWIGNVQRAAMRGLRCDLTIDPHDGWLGNGAVLATVSQTTGTILPNSCLTYSPLILESLPSASRFSISPTRLTFSFTPRGTIANTTSDPVVISITNLAGGDVRCLRLDGLLAMPLVGYLLADGTCQTQ